MQINKIVKVALGNKSYDIIIGHDLKAKIQEFISENIKQKNFSQKALLITDTHIAPLYADKIAKVLNDAGLVTKIAVINSGEESKSLTVAEDLFTQAIEHGLDRKSPVFALGGGVVGDLAGFMASTFMRGVPFVQMPTSLLAQVDSSVGGKVAVNHKLGKNLIGSFYQPKAVFMDLDMMSTLPQREIATGLGEVVKYGYIYDRDFYDYLLKHQEEILRLNSNCLSHVIARSCKIKAEVVSQDEKEAGLRAILNFGHTLGHAIEKETGYKLYNHGEAVAIGMVGAGKISAKLNLIDSSVIKDMEKLLTSLNLPIKAQNCQAENIYSDIFHDKKTVNGKVNWVLLQEIGKVFVTKDVPSNIVKEAIAEILA